jgi:hypothetical protein
MYSLGLAILLEVGLMGGGGWCVRGFEDGKWRLGGLVRISMKVFYS